MAIYGMGIVVAPIIGPTLGGWITDNYSWRWIFYINLPIGLFAAFMANAFVEDPPYLKNQKPGRIDYTGFSLMALGLGALELTLDLGQQRDWFESSLIVFTATFSGLCITRVYRVGALHARADRQSSRFSQPQLRRRLRDDRLGRRRSLWLDGALAAVFADAAWLSGRRERICR